MKLSRSRKCGANTGKRLSDVFFGNNRGSGVIISDDSQDESEPLGDAEEEQLLPGPPLNVANVARRWI